MKKNARSPRGRKLVRALARWGGLTGMLVLPSVAPLAGAEVAADQPSVIIVVGAEGETEFGSGFATQAEAWEQACKAAGAKSATIGLPATGEGAGAVDGPGDLDRLKETLQAETKDGPAQLWIVLIGHGTFDGKEPKFNLRGPDLTAADLLASLQPFQRSLALIDTSSASAPFMNKLAGKNRVVITATRSGYEQNFTRFGQYLAESIGDAGSDLDKDGQVSLLEAFLAGSTRVAEFYKAEGRLVTEHALAEDNGDGLGTPAEWFRGIRATKRAKDGAALDGLRAHQFILLRSPAEQKLSPEMRAQRDELESAIAKLREDKAKLPVDDYYQRLERLMLQLAALYAGGT